MRCAGTGCCRQSGLALTLPAHRVCSPSLSPLCCAPQVRVFPHVSSMTNIESAAAQMLANRRAGSECVHVFVKGKERVGAWGGSNKQRLLLRPDPTTACSPSLLQGVHPDGQGAAAGAGGRLGGGLLAGGFVQRSCDRPDASVPPAAAAPLKRRDSSSRAAPCVRLSSAVCNTCRCCTLLG